MADTISVTGIQQQAVNYITSFKWLTILGWIVFAFLLIGVGLWGYLWWKNKKLFNKIVVVNEIVNGEFVETYRDTAKSVKIGSGGFELIFLRKLKTWKLAHGGRTGRNRYDFYIMPDGYWYPAKKSANIWMINQQGGFVPIVTTNPAMRSQYTSLEKQIDALHADKKTFWDAYGSWILSIAFVVIAGLMLWLNYKEYATASGNFNVAIDKMSLLVDKINNLIGNIQSGGNTGLIPAK